ncbi:MAG TPA: cell division protein ZapE [Hyphomicrobiaceae bacterium]|jgi:cell division protein ZapE|nr:cell division protein ZapE [Hyphomicrobiaceae bacterium]
MSLITNYRALVMGGVLEKDPAQASVAARLDALAQALKAWRPRGGPLGRWLGRAAPAPQGRYIFGPVGRGKTMLMDLFFEAVRFQPKRRLHFHEFMAEVHDRIGAARQKVPGDPIPHVTQAIAAEARLLCFDELHVTDIADAMILGRVFKGLFARQVVVVATSNVHPRQLYWNGLNRELFLPFIDLLEQHLEIDELLAQKDFRLDKLTGRPLYFVPADAGARARMDQLWAELTGNHPAGPVQLDVKGRTLRVPKASMGVARFAFADLCERPLGTLDYLQIARTFHVVFIDAIPVLSRSRADVARRFINLVDTLYDNRVCLVASAAAEPADLFASAEAGLLADRTVSRLMEMRSEGYLSGRDDRASVRAIA